MKKIIYISTFFVLLFFTISRIFFDGFHGGEFFFFSFLILGFFTPFFIKKEKVSQMILPLSFVSIFYSFCSIGLMQVIFVWLSQNQVGPLFWRELITWSSVYAVISFLGGLGGVVAQGIITKLTRLQK